MTRESDASELYLHTFAARHDDHVSWTGMMWARAGRPLTADRIAEGIAGTGPTLSTYFLTPESRGHVAAVDFDTDTGLADAKRVRAALAQRGAPAYVEASRRGAHLWVVCDWAHPGRTLRQFLRAAVIAGGVPVECPGKTVVDGQCPVCGHRSKYPEAHDNPKIEWRPLADEIKADGFGAPLRMPTMPNPKTGLRYPVLDLDDRPIPPRLSDLILAVDYAPRYVVESMAATIRPTFKQMALGDRAPFSQRRDDDDRTASEILRTMWGMPEPKVGRANKCPAHDDANPSLSIAKDDKRVFCKTPGCVLDNNGRGRGTHELARLAPGAAK